MASRFTNTISLEWFDHSFPLTEQWSQCNHHGSWAKVRRVSASWERIFERLKYDECNLWSEDYDGKYGKKNTREKRKRKLLPWLWMECGKETRVSSRHCRLFTNSATFLLGLTQLCNKFGRKYYYTFFRMFPSVCSLWFLSLLILGH